MTAQIPEQTSAPSRAANLIGLWSNPKTRTMIILSAVIVGAVVVYTITSARKMQSIPAAAQPVRAPTPGGQKAEATPYYRDLVATDNEARAAAALASPNKSTLPKIVGLSEPEKKRQEADAQRAPLTGLAPAPAPTAPQPQAPPPVQNSEAYKNAMTFYASKLAQWDASKATHAVVYGPREAAAPQPVPSGSQGAAPAPQASAQPPVAASPQSGAAQANAPVAQKLVVKTAGNLYYGQITFAVNSDQTGPLFATVLDGPLKGARLIGEKSLEGEALVFKFSTAVSSNGHTLQGTAYAVNIADVDKFGTTGMAGSVDRHVMARYIIPAAAAFVKGMADAVARSNTTTTITAAGTVSTTGPLSSRDQVKIAMGQVGQQATTTLAQDAQRGLQKPITVTMDAGQEVGFAFTTDMVER